EGRPRKVRFKISSACSGRVLKEVFEDGQELEPPAKERSRRFLRHCFEPEGHFCGAVEVPDGPFSPPAKMTAQRISIVRDDETYSLCNDDNLLLQSSSVIDFGKIIIYTSNLKIIRAPIDQKELVRRVVQTEGVNDWAFTHRERREQAAGGYGQDLERRALCQQYILDGDAEYGCSQCQGSGSAPCSLCHGSKFSTLAGRFRESYRALRCPACNESGLQPCQVCAA
ncbi:GRCR2 protein, partial [Rhinopomastus cyanomelas]|nr:GRCR2 protein [Rhinopomastus cyanomelas]